MRNKTLDTNLQRNSCNENKAHQFSKFLKQLRNKADLSNRQFEEITKKTRFERQSNQKSVALLECSLVEHMLCTNSH